MIEVAHAEMTTRAGGAGPDAALIVNGREVSTFTLVALLESETGGAGGEVYKGYMLNDATGRIEAKMYLTEADQGGAEESPKPGQYVRVFGSCRTWNSQLQITAHRVKPVLSSTEVPF